MTDSDSKLGEQGSLAPPPNPRRFSGRVVMISGVSDQGIGGATAERFAREGASLAVGYYGSPPKRLLRRLERWNVPHLVSECDITCNQQVASWVRACLERFHRLDVLINNAGIEVASRFEKITDDDWERLLEVNLTGAMRLTRTALPHITAPGGVIAGIASTLALAPCAGFPGYGASKAGLIAMIQGLAVELAPRGIRALCVAPALVPTPMTAHHIARMDGKVDPQQMANSHPLGLGSPHDVAAALAFLTSDDARWITGITLPMGWLPNYLLPLEEFLPQQQATMPTKPQ